MCPSPQPSPLFHPHWSSSNKTYRILEASWKPPPSSYPVPWKGLPILTNLSHTDMESVMRDMRSQAPMTEDAEKPKLEWSTIRRESGQVPMSILKYVDPESGVGRLYWVEVEGDGKASGGGKATDGKEEKSEIEGDAKEVQDAEGAVEGVVK